MILKNYPPLLYVGGISDIFNCNKILFHNIFVHSLNFILFAPKVEYNGYKEREKKLFENYANQK